MRVDDEPTVFRLEWRGSNFYVVEIVTAQIEYLVIQVFVPLLPEFVTPEI